MFGVTQCPLGLCQAPYPLSHSRRAKTWTAILTLMFNQPASYPRAGRNEDCHADHSPRLFTWVVPALQILSGHGWPPGTPWVQLSLQIAIHTIRKSRQVPTQSPGLPQRARGAHMLSLGVCPHSKAAAQGFAHTMAQNSFYHQATPSAYLRVCFFFNLCVCARACGGWGEKVCTSPRFKSGQRTTSMLVLTYHLI